MKAIIVFAFFSLFTLCTKAQFITGKVYRQGTDSVIAGVSVYYGGSLSGTITDNKGQFQIAAKSAQVPLTVSCIGYYSVQVYGQPNRPLMVYLKPRQEELHDVVIRADGMNRKDEIWLFTREFLGLSYAGRNCVISNIADVDFFYNKKNQTFTATCDKPIIIVNKVLGYTISYYLDRFVKTGRQTYFAGNFIFKENPFLNEQDKAKIMRNREEAYNGSRMQLIMAIWNNTLNQSGFNLYTPEYIPLKEKDIVVTDSANNKYLQLDGRVRVIYNNDRQAINTVTSLEKRSFIDSSGFYNAGLRWAGEIAQKRVGDLLPFDYRPPAELKNSGNSKPVPTAIVKKEKKARQTDKALELFKSIVLVKDNPLDDVPVIRKWGQPVYYKIYGTCGNKDLDRMLANFAKSIFKKVADHSSLQITNVTDDENVNFFIILNGDADTYKYILPADAVHYFAAHPQSPGYYTYNDRGFTSMVKLVSLESMDNPASKFPAIGYMLRQHILNGLGFFNLASQNPGSLFYNNVNLEEPSSQIKATDTNIIKTLYRADIMSGMTEQKLDSLLNNPRL